MKRSTVTIIGFMLLLCLFAANASNAPVDAAERPQEGAADYQARSGVIDLRGWKATEDGIIPLEGEWEFYWGRLLEPADIPAALPGDSLPEGTGDDPPSEPADRPAGPGESALAGGLESRTQGNGPASTKDQPQPAYVYVPGTWGSYRADVEGISNQGYATYRLRILLPDEAAGKPLALSVPAIASAYRLWVNGDLLASSGTPEPGKVKRQPATYPTIAYFQSDTGVADLVVQVSNDVQRKGGIWDDVSLGTAEAVAGRHQSASMYEMLLFGCLVIMGFYHLMLYFSRRKSRSDLYFGMICTLMAIRISFVGQVMAVALFPGMSWELAIKLEYWSPMGSLLLLVLFIYERYPEESGKRFATLSQWCAGLYCSLIALTPAIVYTKLLFVYFYVVILPTVWYMLYVYLLAARRKRPGSLLNMVGIVCLCAGIVNDVFYYSLMTKVGDLAPLGLLLFLITQSANMAILFAKAFARAENLSQQLAALNESLEDKVRERTAELERMNRTLEQRNEELSRKEAFRRRLLANISHELMTPLTSLKGYVIAILDKLVSPHDARYWTIIKDKADMLERVIEDLFELTKLETRQIPFKRKKQAILPYMRQLYRKYELAIADGGLTSRFEAVGFGKEDGHGEGGVYADIDAVRIEQVYANLIMNAKKFTPPGGAVTVTLEIVRETERQGQAVVHVTDTGKGIPVSEQEHIFDRYYRGSDKARPGESGLGLGLAICKEIVAHHQGEIGVHSVEGTGSRFYFALPVRFGTAGDHEPEEDGDE